MSLAYEEIVHGESLLRSPPDQRHERICRLLHEQINSAIAALSTTRALAARSAVRISAGSILMPDLALVTAATGKLWLAAEIITPQDHCADTVLKKAVYEEAHLPRLWIIDPRYDNVEIYHGTPYGLVVKRMFAGADRLDEPLLPGVSLSVKELFAA